MTAAAVKKRGLKDLLVEDVVPTKDNPRVIDLTSESMKTLRDSIKALGVLVPVHVRPMENGKYDLRAGERRLWAAAAAGLETIPAIVHEGMTDAAAFELTFAENYEREDLSALEEGKAVSILLKKHGGDVDAVASKMGYTAHAVKLRAAIHERLSDKWVAEITKHPEGLGRWSPAHLELVCRFPANVQNEMLADWKLYRRDPSPWTVREVAERIETWRRLLKTAPWDLDDAALRKKSGACRACPKRSSAEPLLWGHEEKTAESKDRCLDPSCWERKTERYLVKRAKALKKEYPDAVIVGGKDRRWLSGNEEKALEKALQLSWVERDRYTVVKADAKNAIAALVATGKDRGKRVWLKKTREVTGFTGHGNVKSAPKSLKARRETLDRKRWHCLCYELRKKLEDIEYDQFKIHTERESVVLALVAEFGTPRGEGDTEKAWRSVKKRLAAGRRTGNYEKAHKDVLERLWVAVRTVLVADHLISRWAPKTQWPDSCIMTARKVCAIVGIDVRKWFKEISGRKGFTEPKSWANLKADGTPKKAPKKAKAKVGAGKGRAEA